MARQLLTPALQATRVGHLATADARGRPSVVPVCFAVGPNAIYSVIDQKPKRVAPQQLRRVRNVQANPWVALVVDAYRENWNRLWYVLVLGRAALVAPGRPDHVRALALLRRKYRQYRGMQLEDRPVLRIIPHRIVTWSAAKRRPR